MRRATLLIVSLLQVAAGLGVPVSRFPRLNRTALWQRMSLHRFVLSPPGAGIDCHRTYEIWGVGSIPVVLSSPLDGLYRSFGLPMVIVRRWDDVAEAVLSYTHAPLPTEFPTTLTMEYWRRRVLNETAPSPPPPSPYRRPGDFWLTNT
jgi:hypothetical protein